MSESKLIDNPLENIATLVQKQFRQQSARVASKAKTPLPDVVMPALPKDDRMASKRRSKIDSKTIAVLADNMIEISTPEDEEYDNDSTIIQSGSIYSDMEDGTPGERPLTPEEAAMQIALGVRKGHEKGRPDIDWHLVKMLYVYGGWTYERIATECNVSFSMVRLNGRRGRWPEARDRYREEQAQKVQEKLALEEDRLRDWQIIKRRQAGIDGLNWFVKAVSNLRDDASPESIAKLGGLMDRMLSSVTGLAPVEGAPGGAGVSVNVQTNTFNAGAFAPNSPQAKLAAVWEKKVGETDDDHTRRLAYTIRDLYIECDRAGLYDDLKLDSETQRQARLRDRLGIASAGA